MNNRCVIKDIGEWEKDRIAQPVTLFHSMWYHNQPPTHVIENEMDSFQSSHVSHRCCRFECLHFLRNVFIVHSTQKWLQMYRFHILRFTIFSKIQTYERNQIENNRKKEKRFAEKMGRWMRHSRWRQSAFDTFFFFFEIPIKSKAIKWENKDPESIFLSQYLSPLENQSYVHTIEYMNPIHIINDDLKDLCGSSIPINHQHNYKILHITQTKCNANVAIELSASIKWKNEMQQEIHIVRLSTAQRVIFSIRIMSWE